MRAAGTRTVAAVDPVADADYLTFGVWLSAPDTTGVDNTGVEVGAFQAGNSAYTLVAGLTGSATYEGPAVGVKSMGGEVSHVDGTATLTANFGAIDTDAERGTTPPADTTMGSVSGTVDIGGMMVHLGEDSEIGSDGAFSGATRERVMSCIRTLEQSRICTRALWSRQFLRSHGGRCGNETDVDESIAPRLLERLAPSA